MTTFDKVKYVTPISRCVRILYVNQYVYPADYIIGFRE